jgi:hypothetical protein
LENRFRMRPAGVESKKPIGARTTARSMSRCICVAARSAPRESATSRPKVSSTCRRAAAAAAAVTRGGCVWGVARGDRLGADTQGTCESICAQRRRGRVRVYGAVHTGAHGIWSIRPLVHTGAHALSVWRIQALHDTRADPAEGGRFTTRALTQQKGVASRHAR